MPELLGDIGGTQRHRHGVRAQDGKERDDEVVPVLQVEQHAVAFAHAAGLLQVAGERFGCAAAPRDRSACLPSNTRRGLVREALRRAREQVVQPQRRQREAARHVRRPEGEVAGFHGAEV